MFALHRQREGETDFERLWLAWIAVAGAAVMAWLHFGLKTPQCLFHSITGIPCLTCGGTRCVKNLLAGNILTAFEWNPLVFLAVMAAALYALYAAAATALGLPRIRLGSLSPAEMQILRVTAAAVIAANWIYLIFRFSRAA